MLYYGAASLVRQLSPGDGYDKLVPVYVICFMNFRLLHETDQLVYRYQIREQDSGEKYGQQLSIYLCELPRWVKPLEEAQTPIEEWFEILQNMSTFAQKPAYVSSRYDAIFATCQQGRLQPKELEQYFRAMVTEREQQGIAAFYKEEGKLEVAARMLALKMDPTLILEATGLSKEDLERLQINH